ncbi:hypothetical protein MTY_2040 [Moorella thermoacetica Y72]|uniref:Uncharacterized protein n=1 Tax=Moorella thermoacetica Y72 TaxID=1325331 RepID=A0A0S6UGV5_NEOTH|nr:hypothetical protein [Moorella thermoacetica]GAF26700.1 hypothetical protein MTY_2040 [Moorella thermoacetica Y72]
MNFWQAGENRGLARQMPAVHPRLPGWNKPATSAIKFYVNKIAPPCYNEDAINSTSST